MKKKMIMMMMGFMLLSMGRATAQDIVDGIVAIVGEKAILRSKLLQNAQGFALQMGVNPQEEPEKFNRIKRDVLNNMINERVLLAKAVEDTIVVPDEQVTSALEDRIQTLIQQAGSPEAVETYFGIPISKIRRDYREEIQDYLTVQRVQQSKLGAMQVSRRDVESFYETNRDSLPEKRPMVHLFHMMMEIKPGGEARDNAMARIDEIRSRIQSGESFENLAREYSEDPGTASRGGNLGFVERGTLFQSFEEVAFQMEPGQISNIVETSVGLHLIQFLEKRGEQVNIRHILIRLGVSDLDQDATYRRIDEIRNRILAGEDFGALAREHSDDESTKEQGGDLGWLPVGNMQIEAFNAVVDTLKVGELSAPFQTQFGYHMVRLDDRTEAKRFSLEDDWDQIREMAMNFKRQRLLNEWIGELKKDIYIEIKEDMF